MEEYFIQIKYERSPRSAASLEDSVIEDELPASEVEHAVLHEVPGPVLAAGAVGRIEVEGDTVLVRGDLQVLMWTLWTILFFEESGTATIISKAGIFDAGFGEIFRDGSDSREPVICISF